MVGDPHVLEWLDCFCFVLSERLSDFLEKFDPKRFIKQRKEVNPYDPSVLSVITPFWVFLAEK